MRYDDCWIAPNKINRSAGFIGTYRLFSDRDLNCSHERLVSDPWVQKHVT